MIVFFSGGLDSTTLAFDVAQNPWRYSLRKGATLNLLTYGKARNHLEPLVGALRGVSLLPVVHQARTCPFPGRKREKRKVWQTLSPLSSGYGAESMPFTPGLHLWLAAWAESVSDGVDEGNLPPQALFGFQFDAPEWLAYDEGRLPMTDTHPEYVESLNSLSLITHFRAPFLESRMDKTMIAEMALYLGVPVHLTSSCVEGWKAECGVCPQCLTWPVVDAVVNRGRSEWQD